MPVSITSLCLLLLTLGVAPSLAAPDLPPGKSEAVLTPAELRADLAVMRGALEESHVGLYWHVSKADLGRRFERLSASVGGGATQRDFYVRLLPLVAGLRHGHTQLSLPVNGSGYYLRDLNKDGSYFPFVLRLVGRRVYVETNLSDDSAFVRGTEILSIDGKPIRTIAEAMLRCVSADGRNRTFKYHQLSRYKFHALLDLLYGPRKNYRIDARLPDGRRVRGRSVSAASPERLAVLHQQRTGRSIDFFPKPLGFKIAADGKSAVLTVRSFYPGYIEGQGQKYEPFLEASFAEIRKRKIQTLILDVRNNEGGAGRTCPCFFPI